MTTEQPPLSDDDDQGGEQLRSEDLEDVAAGLEPFPRERLIESARQARAELHRRARALDQRPWSSDIDDAVEAEDEGDGHDPA
jgi:hypothetical protein